VVTIAILKYMPFTVCAALWMEKLNFVDKHCSCRNDVRCQVTINVRSAVFRLWHGPTIVWYAPRAHNTRLLPCRWYVVPVWSQPRNSLFECFKLLLLDGNHAAGFKRILKLSPYQLRIEWGLSVPKVTSKCCKLVKFCHINGSNPLVFRHSVNL